MRTTPARTTDPADAGSRRPAASEPIAPAERLGGLDVLRGVAVLGILVMNIRNFGLPLGEFDNPRFPGETLSAADLWVWAVSNVVFEDKMIAIFSMLFGAGIVLMSDRALAAGIGRARAAAVHYRRMFWLFIIGLAHAYGLWYGDILNTYAVCGAALYPLRRLGAGALIGLGVVLLAVTVLIRIGPALERTAVGPPTTPAAVSASSRIMREAGRTEEAAYRGGYVDLLTWRAKLNTAWHYYGGINFSFWRCGGFILIGMGLLRLGVFSGSRPLGVYIGLCLAGYAAGLALFAAGFDPVLGRVLGRVPEAAPEMRRALGLAAWPARFLGSAATAVGHIGLAMIVWRLLGAKALAPLAAAGRMALSNYLLQTVICVVIFDGWGFGQWGRWRMSELAMLVIAIWAAQLVLSPLWLRWFRFGPVEWAWRSLTYWRVQPMLVRG